MEMLFSGSAPLVVFVRMAVCGALVVVVRVLKVREGVSETPSRKLLALIGVEARSAAHIVAMSERRTFTRQGKHTEKRAMDSSSERSVPADRRVSARAINAPLGRSRFCCPEGRLREIGRTVAAGKKDCQGIIYH